MFNMFKKPKKKSNINELQEKLVISHENFIESATDAINIAEDITRILKNQVDDYSKQIARISSMITDGLILCDRNGEVYFSNKACYDIFDYTDTINGINIRSLLDFDSLRIDAHNTVALSMYISERNPQPYDSVKGIKENGDFIYVDISMSKVDKQNDDFYFIIIIRDISQRILIEEELKSVINNSIDMICCCDTDYNLTFYNESFKKIYDMKIGDNLSSILKNYDKDQILASLDDINKTSNVKRSLYKIDDRYLDWYDTGLYDSKDTKLGYQINIRDVTSIIEK